MKTNGAWTGLTFMILLAALCAVPFGAGCGNGETVAVLDIDDRGAQLSEAVLDQLADHLSGKIGEGGNLHVLPRTEDVSEADVAYVLAARILRPGDRCSLVLKLYRHKGRATIRSTSVQTNCNADGLLDAIDVAVFRLGSLGTEPPRVEPPRIVLETRPAEVVKEPPAEETVKTAEPVLVPAPIAPPGKPILKASKEPPKVRKVLHKLEKDSTASEAPKVEQQHGTLLVNSTPWSRVKIDGQFIGDTPLLGVKLPVGPHTVVLETTDGRKKEFAVIIEAGTQRKIIADLAEKLQRAERPPLEPPPEPKTGFLSVNTRPWSKVAVDGKPIGTTPLANHELPPGQYLVSLESSEGQRTVKEVKVEEGETTVIYVNLRRE